MGHRPLDGFRARRSACTVDAPSGAGGRRPAPVDLRAFNSSDANNRDQIATILFDVAAISVARCRRRRSRR